MYNNQFSPEMTLETRVSLVMKRVYVRMCLALIVTAVVAWFTANSPALLSTVAGSKSAYWILALVEVGLVLWISAGINKMSATTATLLFLLFAVVNGFTLSVIFVVYTHTSIVKTFLITAGTFGAMSVYGYFTNRDLSNIGAILVMALFGLIIASIVNIFAHSTQLEWIISIAGVAIFIGLTAWDTQRIKRVAEVAPDEHIGKLATIGALSLYLDFINMFIFLLRIFGQRN